ncbi:hypothetical protein [Novosphingobium sp. FKTRR1]|uniref:hypothetical protein n=1 Tax=Novosphingobium sp. FKTRR1 TaxID=2879118 RepID=UPI001CF0007B|nr:hypothetical protein [Novosphingobium sp. FKTRR1]
MSDTRYAPGDRLYVREAHYLTDDGHNERAVYAADGAEDHITAIKDFRHKAGLSAEWEKRHTRLRPSIHMPRWASRLTLTVTEVRVERLQDISEADAVAEGCVWDSADGFDVWYVPGAQMPRHGATAIECYSLLWNTLHTDPGARWEDNPWVVAISFDVRNGNIDTEASNAQ